MRLFPELLTKVKIQSYLGLQNTAKSSSVKPRGGSRLVQTMLMHRSENCESQNINVSRPIAKTTKGYIQTLDHSLQKYHWMNKRSCWAKIRSKKYITAAKLW